MFPLDDFYLVRPEVIGVVFMLAWVGGAITAWLVMRARRRLERGRRY